MNLPPPSQVLFNAASDLNLEFKARFRSAARLSELGLHFGGCSVTLPFYEFFSRQKEQDPFHAWMTKFVELMNTEIVVHGELMEEPGLFVSNHVSWLDPILLFQVAPFAFIAKKEVQSWPIIGNLSKKMSVVYIERTNKFSVYRSLPNVEKSMLTGESVLFFPEGTTTDGSDTAHFYPMLFEPSVRTNKPVQPILLRYTDPNGRPLPEVAFIDNDSVFDTLFRMLNETKILAHIHLLPPISNHSKHHGCRKRLATRSKTLINQSLKNSLLGF